MNRQQRRARRKVIAGYVRDLDRVVAYAGKCPNRMIEVTSESLNHMEPRFRSAVIREIELEMKSKGLLSKGHAKRSGLE